MNCFTIGICQRCWLFRLCILLISLNINKHNKVKLQMSYHIYSHGNSNISKFNVFHQITSKDFFSRIGCAYTTLNILLWGGSRTTKIDILKQKYPFSWRKPSGKKFCSVGFWYLNSCNQLVHAWQLASK